jgi:hypothetical protein
LYVEHWARLRNAVIGAKNRSNQRTTAIVLLGIDSPAEFIALTLYSALREILEQLTLEQLKIRD